MDVSPPLRFIRRLLLLAALAALAVWAWPRLPEAARAPWHMARLSWQEAPAFLPVPVQGVPSRRLADTWGAARADGRRHEGIDIFAARGTPVLSATEGVVTRVGVNNLGGQVVWVMGPGRQMHYYAHLDGYADIGRGRLVAPGDVLGFVGNTGNARGTPPHLHYGIYATGGALNPYPLLTAPVPDASGSARPGRADAAAGVSR
ncbi:L-Ala--D-Glu endopeptidase precursor [compost metagenome]|uniref:M23 family metallopeptidase n=1 Tax=Achromobacter sp. Root83 TaxID=1736602 RepID=UPI000709A1DD|nr:M23 family metallopeptidase [Achromobacter sp. Root83]KRC86065.1 peptidase M23 [Achromobacter sp. Root83]